MTEIGGYKRVGIFGGSFDPPHKTHIEMAESARKFLGLDLLVFVPACSSPPKFDSHFATFADRAKMLEIALESFSGKFEISSIEAEAKTVCYAADTAEIMAKRFPAAKLYWLAGADMAASIPHWRGIEKLSKIVEFAFFKRAGIPLNAGDFPKNISATEIPFAESQISSSAIRRAIKNGIKTQWLAPKVAEYIAEKRLYTH